MDIVAFEIANIIVRALNLKHSLLPDDIEELKKEVLNSEGVRKLVTEDTYELWCIAAEDKRMELRAVAREVARLGQLCLDPLYHNLTHAFNMLGTVEEPMSKLSEEGMSAELRELELQAQHTAELYHELLSLSSLQQVYERKLADEEKRREMGHSDARPQKDHLASLAAEIKGQEKTVRSLKRKGLWFKRLDSVVSMLMEAVIHLHHRIVVVFGTDVVKMGGLTDRPQQTVKELSELGVSGLAVHYAAVINIVDNLVLQPYAVGQMRDKLYAMMGPALRLHLKRALLASRELETMKSEEISLSLETILDWLVTMAGNTIRYYADGRLQGHTDLTLLQTLYHADQTRTEALMLQLLVGLSHLASREASKMGGVTFSPIPRPLGVSKGLSSYQSQGMGGGGGISAAFKPLTANEVLARELEGLLYEGNGGAVLTTVGGLGDDEELGDEWTVKIDPEPKQTFLVPTKAEDGAGEVSMSKGLSRRNPQTMNVLQELVEEGSMGLLPRQHSLPLTSIDEKMGGAGVSIQDSFLADEDLTANGLPENGEATDPDHPKSKLLQAQREGLDMLPQEESDIMAALARQGKDVHSLHMSKSLDFAIMKGRGRGRSRTMDFSRLGGGASFGGGQTLMHQHTLDSMTSLENESDSPPARSKVLPRCFGTRSLSRSHTFYKGEEEKEVPRTVRVRIMKPINANVDGLEGGGFKTEDNDFGALLGRSESGIER